MNWKAGSILSKLLCAQWWFFKMRTLFEVMCLQCVLMKQVLKVCPSMWHTWPGMTKHVSRQCLQRHGRNAGSYVGYVGFQFIQTVWVIAARTASNVASKKNICWWQMRKRGGQEHTILCTEPHVMSSLHCGLSTAHVSFAKTVVVFKYMSLSFLTLGSRLKNLLLFVD